MSNFLIGLFIGAAVGIFFTALCAIRAISDELFEKTKS